MTRTSIGEELAKTLKNIGIFLVCAALIYLLLVVGFRLLQKERPGPGAGALPNRESGQVAGVGMTADSRGVGRPADGGGRRVDRSDDGGEREAGRRADAGSPGFADTAGYWVYLGQFSGKRNRWLCKNFDIQGLPAEGQEIVSLADLFVWDDLPCLRGRDWKLGMIMGLVPSSVPVLVVKVQEIGSGIYWALIRQ